jgi:hypothetical protein
MQQNEEIVNICKPSELIINSPDRLLDSFLKRPPNTHYLSYTLHTAAQQATDAIKLLQIPSWNFNNNIIQAGLEASARDFGDGILDLVQWDAETEFGSDECQWVSGRLRR